MDNESLAGFPPRTVEKVDRLLDLLEEMGEHPLLQGKLALHGGTAINLFMLSVPRLSVDIDVSYVGAVDREDMLAERPDIERGIQEIARSQGYSVTGNPGSHAGCTFVLNYRSKWGPDHVKIDCVFLNRSPVTPLVTRSTPMRSGFSVLTFGDAELIGGKVKAFYDRVKVRDLYDVNNLHRVLSSMDPSDESIAHTVILFYASLSASFPFGFEQRPQRFDGLEADLKEQLFPMLSKRDDLPFLDTLINGAEEFVQERVLPRSEAEREYLDRFAHADFVPELLFKSPAMVDAAASNPQALWKLYNLEQMR